MTPLFDTPPVSRSRVSVAAPRRLVAAVVLTLAWAGAPPAGAAISARPVPHRASIDDLTQRIDVNQISMVVTNTGSIAFDKPMGNPGLEFPHGSGKTAVFAAGPWLGAIVDGDLRVALSEYWDEFGPGPAPGGVPADPLDPLHRVYSLRRVYAVAADRDAALAAYEAGAEPHGAPDVEIEPDGTLNILGDQMLWAVYNDLDPSRHTAFPGTTAPLGVEVRQTVYAYDRPGALGRTVFVRHEVLNVGAAILRDFRYGLWADPDLGGVTDDLVGCDSTRGLGYCYNGAAVDAVYGAAPPAIGFDLLAIAGPGGPDGATAFVKYTNGTDPTDATQVYRQLSGLRADGNPIIDPTTGLATTFVHGGDPVAGTGWLDSAPGDRRQVLASGPFDLIPGGVVDATVAIVIGQGADRFDSIDELRGADDAVQAFFDGATPECPVTVAFSFKPEVLNLRSMGRWVGGRLEPPAPYGAGDIDIGSILLNGTVAVDPAAPSSVGDADGNGAADLTVKFDRAAVQAALVAGSAVPVTVTGTIGAECFTGSDVARVLHVPVVAPDHGALVAPGASTPVRWERPPQAVPLWVAVLASMNGGQDWQLVADHLPNTGIYEWHPPYASTTQARIAVVLVEEDLGDGEVEGWLGLGDPFTVGTPTGVLPPGGDLALHGAWPQPSRGTLRLSLTLPDARHAALEVFDPAGRRVAMRDVGALGAGTHTVSVGEGDALPPGVYLVRLSHAGAQTWARAVLVR